MPHYDSVNGVARKVVKMYDSVNDVARSVVKAYDSVDGVARVSYKKYLYAEELPLGSSIYIPMTYGGGGGENREFIVVHQGIPNEEVYDSSCYGTWLLMKDVLEKSPWSNPPAQNPSYVSSDMPQLLETVRYTQFTKDIYSIFKDVKIPYIYWDSINGEYSYKYGSDGLQATLFLLSRTELGIIQDPSASIIYKKEEGSCLDYFKDGDRSKRISYYEGSQTPWFTRTVTANTESKYVCTVNVGGDGSNFYAILDASYKSGVRPAVIIPSKTLIDETNYSIII